MRSLSMLSGLFGSMLTLASCGGGSSGADLFAESGRGGLSGDAGRTSGGSGSPFAVGGALSAAPSGAGTGGSATSAGAGPGLQAGSAGRGDAGSTSSGGGQLGGSAAGGGTSVGGAASAGSAAGGSSGGSPGAAGGGTSGGSPAGGSESGGSSGNTGSAGGGEAGGLGNTVECAARRLALGDLLAAAQSCNRDSARACSGTVEDECGCAVPVSNSQSDAAEAYAEAAAFIRSECLVPCLAIQCPEQPRGAQCVMEGGQRGRCTGRGAGLPVETN